MKVKSNEGPDEGQQGARKLAEGTGAERARPLGRTALLFKKREEHSEFGKL